MARNESWQPTSNKKAGLTASVPIPAKARVLAGRFIRSAIAARQNVVVMTVERTTEGANPTRNA